MMKFISVILCVQLLQADCLYDGDRCAFGEDTGICRPLSKCFVLLTEIRKAGSPMPLHIRKKLEAIRCGFEDSEPVVCCPSTTELVSVTEVPNRGGIRPTRPNNSDNTVDPDNVEEFTRRTIVNGDGTPPNIQNHRNLRLLPTRCGNMDSDKIWGGQTTSLLEMPWMVLLTYNHPARGESFNCGGTLITERYVITAAHCVKYLGSLTLTGVILGEYDLRTDPDCTTDAGGEKYCAPNRRNVTIEEVIAHPGYTLQTWFDDIALLRLAQPADFKLDSMKPICLPLTSELQTESLVGRIGVVAGWGVTENKPQADVLMSLDVPIISNQNCSNIYKGARVIQDSQLCAGGQRDKDTCGGDSGGPLMYPGLIGSHGAQYVQRGIISYGTKRCGIGGFAGVYTKVASYMDWILDNIRS